MVKAGVYLIARLSPSLAGTDLWIWVLTPVGAFTMVLASVWAMRQTDLKLMLAYTTIMGLSVMVMLLGTSNPMAVTAAMTFLLVHAFYKASLFLAVGMIERGAGSRNYPDVAGLARALPLTAVVIAVAALSMAGVPPLFGFIGKEAIYGAAPFSPIIPLVVVCAALVANALMVGCAGMVAVRPFYGHTRRAPRERPADPGWGLWIAPAVLAALGLACGMFPGTIEHELIGPMVLAVAGVPMPIHLVLWHGLNPALGLSLITLGLGVLLYLGLDRIRDTLDAAAPRLPRTEGWYDAGLAALTGGAARITGAVQDGEMTRYLRRSFMTLALLIWIALILGRANWPALLQRFDLIDAAIFTIVIAAIIAVLRTHSRLVAITALGGIGAGIALVFVLYGAIDVAMTQLFVEILVVIFLAIAMARLPAEGAIPFRAGNALVAVALGVGVTLVQLSVLGTDLDRFMTAFFEERSAPEAFGTGGAAAAADARRALAATAHPPTTATRARRPGLA
jgi:multicomponent Na+:H+ antiporter subunit A